MSPTANTSSAVAEADCGSHVVQFEGLPDAAIACFLDAVCAKRRARLAVTRSTVEGDPIHILYVADATGTVQMTTDSRQDTFGAQEVTRQTCTGGRPRAHRIRPMLLTCPRVTLILRPTPEYFPWSNSCSACGGAAGQGARRGGRMHEAAGACCGRRPALQGSSRWVSARPARWRRGRRNGGGPPWQPWSLA